MFNLGVAVLAAFGLDGLSAHLQSPFVHKLWRALALLAGFIMALGLAARVFQKLGPNDLLFMLALIAALFAAVVFARQNGRLSGRMATAAVLALVFIEIGNVSAAIYWERNPGHRETSLPQLAQFHDIADFLRRQPGPVRIHAMEVSGAFNFGEWEGIDTLYGFGAGVTKNLFSLDWPSARTQNLLAVGYTLSKQPPRPDQQVAFQSAAGFTVLRNSDALPRARIVHRIHQAASAEEVRVRVDDASFDTRNVALMLGSPPQVQSCSGDEQARITRATANSVTIDAQLACTGMLVLADTWYPGWIATVDGHSVPIYQVYSALRGVIVQNGEHRVEFHYRPVSALIGALLSAIGILGACALALWNRRGSGQHSRGGEALRRHAARF
jgi:hypothetical protein